MKIFRWNVEKNGILAQERGITFEEIVERIESGCKVIDVEHPNKDRYPNQRILIVDLDGYAYMVPYVESEQEYFLKTIIPSRKATRKYFEDKMAEKQKTLVLDEYENEIVDAFESGVLVPAESETDFQEVARHTMRGNRKINIRISENDLSALRRRAARDGIPYQTLIRSVLHKFASGFLKEAL